MVAIGAYPRSYVCCGNDEARAQSPTLLGLPQSMQRGKKSGPPQEGQTPSVTNASKSECLNPSQQFKTMKMPRMNNHVEPSRIA